MTNLQELIQKMPREEKVGLLSGKDFWNTKAAPSAGLPEIMVTDGPHGLRKQEAVADHLGLNASVPATCFPAACAIASSWDRQLIQEMGRCLGEECLQEQVSVLLGPGCNIKRSPLCGRNFEYFSEDPLLSSAMAEYHIKGVQSQGVGTSIKHFLANNQEDKRMIVDTLVDERTLREIYLASFEGAVKNAKPWTVMCSYNKLNGTYLSEHKPMLNDLLKEEWGFEGVVVTDWGAANDRVKGLRAGLDLEMPASNGINDAKVLAAIRRGELDEACLDRAVERLLRVLLRCAENRRPGYRYDAAAHQAVARRVAAESAVLLKNSGILPLAANQSIAFIGELAEAPRYQGGGSSHINPTRLVTALEEGKKVCPGLLYAKGFRQAEDQTDPDLLEEACQTAAQVDVVVLFLGLPDRYESEGYDRTHLNLPENQLALFDALHQVNANLVVVLSNGSPILMPFAQRARAILEMYLPGQEGGGAAVDLLFGSSCPCGKLAETFPQQLEHNPSYPNFPGERDTVSYREGVLVGYRGYEKKALPVLFPFGFGLSYTTFAYSGLELSHSALTHEDTVTVRFRVRNTGTVAGKEIAQLYVQNPVGDVIRPIKELRDFVKVPLAPGEERTVTLELSPRAFAFYDCAIQDWNSQQGEYRILVGASSQDIRLEAPLTMLTFKAARQVFDINSTIGQMLANPASAPIGQMLHQQVVAAMGAFAPSGEEGESNFLMRMVGDLPLRALCMLSNGAMSEELIAGLLYKLNE